MDSMIRYARHVNCELRSFILKVHTFFQGTAVMKYKEQGEADITPGEAECYISHDTSTITSLMGF